jgi:hypothetical protein
MKTKGWNACAAALLIVLAGVSAEAASRFDELAARYETTWAGNEAAVSLRLRLAALAENVSPLDLRDSLLRGDMSPEQRAANALALLDSLVPGGDPARWNEVAGFWRPREIPKPLAAVDALFVAVSALSPMDDPGAPWLARKLLLAFLSNPAAALLFADHCPAEYAMAIDLLARKGVLPPHGVWRKGDIVGRLPLAREVRGFVTRDRAFAEGMTFLDAVGRPVPNGTYAWDRTEGRIYEVVEDRSFWMRR